MIDATAAAGLHKSWTAKLPGGISVGSPSVARGGKAWMEVCQGFLVFSCV